MCKKLKRTKHTHTQARKERRMEKEYAGVEISQVSWATKRINKKCINGLVGLPRCVSLDVRMVLN